MAASQSNSSDANGWNIGRIKETLLRNPAVCNNDAIAEMLSASGRIVEFTAGTEFITAGPSNDEVYFLLSGTVNVHLADGRRVCRTAPTQVGEMAVIHRGSPRSACVKAAKGGVIVWKITGDCLSEVFGRYPEFKERMHSEMADRHRELAASVPIKSGWVPVAWTLLSILAAGLFSCIAWWLAAFAGATLFGKCVASVAAGLLVYVLVSIRNPAFFWRRMMGTLIVFAIAMFGLQRSIKFEVGNGDQMARFELSSDGIMTDQITLIAIIIAFVVVFITLAVFQYQQDKRS